METFSLRNEAWKLSEFIHHMLKDSVYFKESYEKLDYLQNLNLRIKVDCSLYHSVLW